MISPIKGRPTSALEERTDFRENENRPKPSIKTGKNDAYTKGKVTKCINSIKDTVSYLNDNIKRIKQKSHGLAVLFNPLLNRFSEISDPVSRYFSLESDKWATSATS
jgi:hypothetical protein